MKHIETQTLHHIRSSTDFKPACRALLLHIRPIPQARLVEEMLALQDDALLIHFLQADRTTRILLLELNLHFLGDEH